MRGAPVEPAGALRVVLVDDHDIFRQGLRELFEEAGFEVAGEAATGEAALTLVGELSPDVVVMDLSLPGMSGVEATAKLTSAAPRSRVLVLTISTAGDDVLDALLAGACGYLLKDASVADLLAGVRSAAAGESSLSPQIAAKLVSRLRGGRREAPPADGAAAELSSRELEVLKLLAEGKDNAEIARELFISPNTVKNHISSILSKLELDNRVQAAVYAVRRGIA